jgi:general secretion pathway protein A
MYTKFFGLNEKPFAITPDPRYLFMSARHGEGLAHLVYGVTESGGFIQLTGEVGTGKTTLVRTLLSKLPDEVDIALILNPQVTVLEFLQVICQELAVPPPEDMNSSMAIVDALNRYLLDAHSRGRRTILLVDEAQNLSTEVLEQLRLLTNLETAKQKLLQIILIGQPELRKVLAQYNLRQLAQRVTGRYHLEPLSRDEAMLYIDHRLKVAGGLSEIFDKKAKRQVYSLSSGVPRVMNVICDRALLGAYGQESRKVTAKIVRRAASEVSGQSPSSHSLKWAAGLLAVAALIMITTILRLGAKDNGDAAADVARETAKLEIQNPAPETAPEAAIPPVTDTRVAGPGVETLASAEPGPSFEQQLTSGNLNATFDQSMATVLSLWGIESESAALWDCGQLRSRGFSCLLQSGSWNVLTQLDRPAILTLVDSYGVSYHSVLIALDESTVELAFGDNHDTYSIDDVSPLWFGRFLIVWRPPNGSGAAIAPGMRNNNVAWLRDSLATLGNVAPANTEDTDFFDSGLEEQLRNFQRQNRLLVDGLAGQQTQIIINSQLAIEGTPQLSGGG